MQLHNDSYVRSAPWATKVHSLQFISASPTKAWVSTWTVVPWAPADILRKLHALQSLLAARQNQIALTKTMTMLKSLLPVLHPHGRSSYTAVLGLFLQSLYSQFSRTLNILLLFIARQHARVSMLTRDIYIANLSVCLSVCPSVRP